MLDLDMGRYGLYVWGAWGATALGLAVIALRAVAASRRWKRELDRLEKDR